MEQKAKVIILILIGVSVMFLLLFVQASLSKQNLQKTIGDLKKDNEMLSANLDKSKQDLRRLDQERSTLNKEVDRLNRERADAENKYALAKKSQDELIERIKAMQGQMQFQPQVEPQAQMLPQNQEAYWAGILKAKADLEMQLISARDELRAIQINNEQLQREKSNMELDLNSLKREKEDVKRQLDYNQKLMDSVTQDLVRERNDKIQIQDNLKIIKNENAVLARQIKSLTSHKIELEKKLEQVKADRENVESKYSNMNTMLSDKISKINELKDRLEAIRSGAKPEMLSRKNSALELPPIVVYPQSETSVFNPGSYDTLSGKILAINRDNNFVIVDLGEDTGIKVGDSFQVYREDTRIGVIEIIKVSKTVSAADIKKESTSLKIGDTIK